MDIAIIENKIYEIRGQKVMLDFDLAQLYEVETKALNQAVKRNAIRFLDDFMFRLTDAEWRSMQSQFATSSLTKDSNWSQIVTSSQKHSGWLPKTPFCIYRTRCYYVGKCVKK